MIVYKHIRLDTDDLFYIGIGSKVSRAFSKHRRNTHWHNIVNKVGYRVEIITECETREEACKIEQDLISQYGRIGSDPNGILVNMTKGGDGGDTTTGHPNREEIINKRADALRGIPRPPDVIKAMTNGWKKWYDSLTDKEKQSLSNKQMSALKDRRMTEGLRDSEIKHREESKSRLMELNKSEKRRLEQSIRMKEQQTGKIFTDEHKKNIGKSSKGRISVHRKAVIIDDIEYAAQGIASKSLNMPMSTLKRRLNSDNFPQFRYK
tara:strand:- start:83 stop:874 length:792 start_codon:yes stop_codon:yes gene_type:complete